MITVLWFQKTKAIISVKITASRQHFQILQDKATSLEPARFVFVFSFLTSLWNRPLSQPIWLKFHIDLHTETRLAFPEYPETFSCSFPPGSRIWIRAWKGEQSAGQRAGLGRFTAQKRRCCSRCAPPDVLAKRNGGMQRWTGRILFLRC